MLSVISGAAIATDPLPPWVRLPPRAGAPLDWSHRHLVHSNPQTEIDAARAGQRGEWERQQDDPRFLSAVLSKERRISHGSGVRQFREVERVGDQTRPGGGAPAGGEHRDWSYFLGFTAGAGASNVFPAKYSFDIAAAPDCTKDFVAFPTNAAGSGFVAGTPGSAQGSFTGSPLVGQTVTLQSGSRALVLTASAASNAGANFQIGGTTAVTAANLAAAIVRLGSAVGVTATVNLSAVTVTALGPGNSGITVSETLSNFFWNVGGGNPLAGGTGTAGQSTILAFNGLYSSCGSPFPRVLWSYNTGTGSRSRGSPVLSLDGTQVAFVQTSAANVASLVVLKWRSGDGGIVTPVTLAASATYLGCTAPCMKVVPFNGARNATNSQPYYDYLNDVVYVGDDGGVLHKFTGVFQGEPVETVAAPWPATISAGNLLSSPVYDSASDRVFVGSAAGVASGGQLHSFAPATGTLVSSARLTQSSSTGVAEAPVVDSSAQKLYVFVGASAAAANGTTCTGTPCMAVHQFDTNFAANSSGVSVQTGRGTTAIRMLAGSFNDAYFASAVPASPSGSLYVCGSQSAAQQRATLWRIQVSNNVLGAATEGPRLANGASECSGITIVKNGAAEYLFTSVSASGNQPACTGACLYMFNLTGITWATGTAASAGLPAPGGTGGIVVDNVSPVAGASQVYYATVTSPGNAIQAGQAGLQ